MVKSIPHVDFLSHRTHFKRSLNESDCMLVQPLPVDRTELVKDIHNLLRSIITAMKRRWNVHFKRKFPEFYKRREERSLHPERFLCFNSKVVVSLTCRSSVLDLPLSPFASKENEITC